MVKVVIFDADGVVVNKPAFFSECLARDYDIPLEKIRPFFQNEFQPCLVGKADLKEQLKKYLPIWGWKVSVDDLLAYWFKAEHYIDERLVKSIENCRRSGVRCYLATVQEKYRTTYLKEQMGFDKLFDGIFSSAELGYRKQDSEFWQKVFNSIGVKEKPEVLVWDDDQVAIDTAQAFGFNAHLYSTFELYKRTMELDFSLQI